MNRFSFSSRTGRARNCRTLLTPSRVRKNALAERLDKKWNELLRYATIERDPEKMLRLTAELDRRKQHAEAIGKRNGK